MIEIEKYARAAASTARTPPNSPARRAAIDAENAARVAAEQFAADQAQRIADLETKVDTLKRLHDAVADERDELRAELDEWRFTNRVDVLRRERDTAVKERDGLRARTVPAQTGLTNCLLPDGIRYALPPLVLTGHQLKQALDFVNPDFGSGTEIDAQQMGSTVCMALRGPGEDADGEPAPAGLYCWLEECQEEGSIMLADARREGAEQVMVAAAEVGRRMREGGR